MPSYPFTYFSQDTTVDTVDEMIVSRARSGSVKARLLQTNPKKTWTVIHKLLNSTDKTTLDNFYASQRALADKTFTYTWYGTGYTVIFSTPIKYTPAPGNLWKAEFSLVEV